MTAVKGHGSPMTYYINGKNLSGAQGALFARSRDATGDLMPVHRLVFRLTMPGSHYRMLEGYFSCKELFVFEVRRQMKTELTITAVLSKIDKTPSGELIAQIEFDVL